jgi:hypothetical protein
MSENQNVVSSNDSIEREAAAAVAAASTCIDPTVPATEPIQYTVSAARTVLTDSYIRVCEKNKKFLGTREKALDFLLDFALETLTKREQNTLDRHNQDAFMKEKAQLEQMYDLLLDSKSPMSLEDKYKSEKALMFKYSIGSTRA